MDEDKLPGKLGTALETLRMAGSVPPEASWDYLVEWEGEEATDALLEVVEEGGQQAIHAVRILGERGDVEAVEPLIDLLVDGEVDKLMRDEITFAFHKFGASAAGPLLDAHDRARESGDADRMLTLLEAAFETGAAGTEMSEALAAQVESDPAVVRRMLPDYERTDEVVELLEERAAEIPELDPSEQPDGEVIQAVWNTIEQLGGDIPDALRRQMQPSPPEDSEAESYIKRDTQ